MQRRFDVAIIGGGIAGLATAIRLQACGFSAVVLERGNHERERIAETLPPEVRIPLAALGLSADLASLTPGRAPARLSYWGSRQVDTADYIYNAHGEAWVVARPALDRMLAAAAAHRGVTLHANARVEACRRVGKGWRLSVMHDGDRAVLHCGFTVMATGRRSSVLRVPGSRRATLDRLIAIVGILERPACWPAGDHRPMIEAAPEGWWYCVLSPIGRIHVSLMTDADLAQQAAAAFASRQAWLATALAGAPHTRERLGGRLVLAGSPQIVPANTYLHSDIVADGRLAVGEASLAFDPLAGQGSHAALAGALRAAEAIHACHESGPAALHRYAADEHMRFNQLRAQRTACYRLERRWPSAPFWQRRHAEPRLAIR
jgi:flavin-dependent dehydrogenase